MPAVEGCGACAGSRKCQQHRDAGWAQRLYAMAERQRGHRVGPDDHTSRRDSVPAGCLRSCELGYELYIPTEYTLAVYDALLKQETACGIPLVHFGLMSLDSLRLEKGYRDYGVDLDNSDTPLEAGLGFVVDFSKDFIGKSALLRQKNAGVLTKRLVQVLLTEPEPLLFGREPCLRDGKVIGYLRSAAYAHHLGGACGLAQLEIPEGVTAETLKSGKIEVECLDGLISAIASLAPLYDPKSLRVRV